jgi:pimeloyl-ACP methyl ester carboxylesterase
VGLSFHRDGSGEPLVLVHALGASRLLWEPVLPLLSARHDVISVDLPGFGASTPVDEPSVPRFADTIEGLLDELGVADAHVAGNSLGGWLAIELARRGRARTAVAISPAGMGTDWENRRASATLAVARALAKPSAALAGPLSRRAAGRVLLSGGMFGRPTRLEPGYIAALAREYAAGPGFTATRRWLFTHSAAGLGEIDSPVLIAWGTRDTLLPPRQARRFADAIPGAELRMLPGLGHSPMADDPELVASLISDFAARGSVRSPA